MAILEYIVLAVLLGFIVMKLYSVLGKRTGHENPPRDFGSDRVESRSDNVIRLPQSGAQDSPAEDESRPSISAMADPDSPLAKGLMDIQLADRTFEPDGFLHGAKSAYEMIVTAFAAGDRDTLRPLLDPDVMSGFDAAIADRESRGETMDFQFVGFDSATLVEAGVDDRVAEITVKFVTQVISVKKNENGAVIEGDPSQIVRVTDVWTFARDTRSSDPNWQLVATSE